MLSKFGRWALGLYGPSTPDDLRLTDAVVLETGRTEIRPNVTIPAERAKRLAARQERQHARIQELQFYVSEDAVAGLDERPPDAPRKG